ncbi:TetR/AcrR family transcriptional regulator [Actinoplanes sp. CA-051413]|uniref:TetR/AcrR family transcriptional regulator n=1 Tax=Actinoplanes sp. CA-051413 TaxID=3239899 RepID=UPI003D9724A0
MPPMLGRLIAISSSVDFDAILRWLCYFLLVQVTRRTFTNEARRAQIVEHAIETIAELGSAGASFARIAQRAGLSSTRLISYHFAGRDDLMNEVARRVLAEFAAYVHPRVDAQTTAAGQLRAFIEANLDFLNEHRTYLRALAAILGSAAGAGGASTRVSGIATSDQAAMEELFREGQRNGEFRRFDTRVMAVAVLALRNAVIGQLADDPALDLEPYRRELVLLIELATCK